MMDGGQTLLHETKVSEGLTLITVPSSLGHTQTKNQEFFPKKK